MYIGVLTQSPFYSPSHLNPSIMWKYILVFVLFPFIILAQEEQLQMVSDTSEANQLIEEVNSHLDANEFPKALEKINLAREIYIKSLGELDEKVAETWHLEALTAYYQGNTANALICWNKALIIWDKALGTNNPNSSKVLVNLGSVLFEQGKYQEGLEHMERGLAITIAINGIENPKNYNAILNNAVVCRSLGLHEKAINHLLMALDIAKKNEMELAEVYIEIALNYIKSEKYNEARTYIDLGYEFENKIEDLYVLGSLYEADGYYNIYQKKSHLAIPLLKKGLAVFKKYYGEIHTSVATLNHTLGQAYSNKGDNKAALNYFNQSIIIQDKVGLSNHPHTAASYNNIAEIYHTQGNISRSIEYLHKALSISQIILPEKHENISAMYNNLGVCYNEIDSFLLADKYLSKGLNLRKELFGEISQSVAESHLNLGVCAERMGDNIQAVKHFKESIRILETTGEPIENTNALSSYYNLGKTLNPTTHFKESFDYLQKAIAIAEKEPDHFSLLPKYYMGKGRKYFEINDYENALALLMQSYNLLVNRGEENSSNQIEENFQLINTLELLSDVHFAKYLELDSEKDIIKANQYIQEAIEVIDNLYGIQKNFNKKNLLDQAKNIYSKAIRINNTNPKNKISNSFLFAEKSKSSILLDALQNSNALSFSGIPDTLLQKEYNLSVDIAYFDKQISEKMSSGLSETDSIILSLSSEKFSAKREYETLLSQLENEYEDYYQAKYKQNTIELETVQSSLLSKSESLVEYVVTDSFLYTLLVNTDTLILKENRLDFPLQEHLSDLRNGLTEYHTSKGLPSSMLSKLTKQYVQSSSILYDILIRPIKPYLNSNIIVIPDGILGYLPFEILLSSKPEKLSTYHNYPYLLKDHSISYCYSATLLHQMINRKHKNNPTKNSLTIAPFYNGNLDHLFARIDTMELLALRNDTLQTLNYSGEEAAKVAKMTSGDKWIGQEATLENFLREAPNYRMLHLSTHGVANDKIGDYAYLAFGNDQEKNQYNKLYIRDIYNLPLNADMVVLSACNTAYGKLQKGEGIISLARAFAYAGSKSIITTHWSVDDKSTGELMEDFYQELINNKLPKNEALRQAKLNYIQLNKGLKAHPYFWAAFIGIGDMSPIQN